MQLTNDEWVSGWYTKDGATYATYGIEKARPMDFKVGDKVRLVEPDSMDLHRGFEAGHVFTVLEVHKVYVVVEEDNYPLTFNQIEHVNNQKTLTKPDMNIKEKFVLALTSEPKKSFRKAGITNGDDLLTDEGEKVFLAWLLHSKYADEFKTAVVDGLLEETKE